MSAAGSVDSTDLVDLAFGAVLNRTRRMRLLAEMGAANLREQRGCEVSRDDMLSILAMVEELADDVLSDLDQLKPAGFDEVAR